MPDLEFVELDTDHTDSYWLDGCGQKHPSRAEALACPNRQYDARPVYVVGRLIYREKKV